MIEKEAQQADQGEAPVAQSPEESEAEHQNQLHRQQLAKARRVALAKSLAVLAIMIVLILFVIQNSQPVRVNYLFGQGNPRLIWVIVFCATLGGAAGYLIGRPARNLRLHDAGAKPVSGNPKKWGRR